MSTPSPESEANQHAAQLGLSKAAPAVRAELAPLVQVNARGRRCFNGAAVELEWDPCPGYGFPDGHWIVAIPAGFSQGGQDIYKVAPNGRHASQEAALERAADIVAPNPLQECPPRPPPRFG